MTLTKKNKRIVDLKAKLVEIDAAYDYQRALRNQCDLVMRALGQFRRDVEARLKEEGQSSK